MRYRPAAPAFPPIACRDTPVAAALLLGCLAAPAPAQNQDPRPMSDRTWIALSGTVESADDVSFELDIGESVVTVEMDDRDWYEEAFEALDGEALTVYAYVEDDLFDDRSVEAIGICIGLDCVFPAPGAAEPGSAMTYRTPGAEAIINGTVMATGEDFLRLDTGLRALTVLTEELGHDPLDGEEDRQIEVGDRVAVSGEVDEDFFEKREFEADSIVPVPADTTMPVDGY